MLKRTLTVSEIDYDANAEVSIIQLSHSHSESIAVAQCGPFTSFSKCEMGG
jgi:hypothetical protein